MSDIADFVRESNRIEGILREPSADEVAAHQNFLALERIEVPDLVRLVGAVQPGARLRSERGLNVRIGGRIAPPGGPAVVAALEYLLSCANMKLSSAWDAHVRYEWLHPFTDGNGRSGRALWLWMMGGHAPLGFLHHFYYHTLAQERER